MISSLSILLWLMAISQCWGSLIDICTRNRNSEKRPLLAALLDLHTGELCDQPVVSTFQQLAVLEATINEINQNNRIKIGFQVFDTCSSEQGAVTASMQAFVASQQTCLHSPLFTGFVGPENIKFLRAVKNFTSSFNFTHILPYSILTYGSTLNKALFVAKYPVIAFAQVIETLAKKMELKSPQVISEEGLIGYALSRYLGNLRTVDPSNTNSCPKWIVNTVSNQQQLEESLEYVNNHDGVIFIVESDWATRSIYSMLLQVIPSDFPVIIVDIKNTASTIPDIWPTNVFVVNQLSFSESENNKTDMARTVGHAIDSFVADSNKICKKYKLKTCNEEVLSSVMENDYDWTLQLYRMGILLLGSLIKSYDDITCGNKKSCLAPEYTSQSEWHEKLLITSHNNANYKLGDMYKLLTFNMELPATYILKTSFGSEGFKKIGRIESGDVKLFKSKYDIFFATKSGSLRNITCPQLQANPTTVPTTQLDFLDHLLNPENAKLFEAVGMVCGAVIGILLLMLVMTSCVYRSFNPESSSPRSPSSHTTMSRAGSITS